MIWTVSGCVVAAYQLVALATGRTRVSVLAHRWPFGVLIVGWYLGLGVHLIDAWLEDALGERAWRNL